MMQCSNCGAAVVVGDKFCEECGASLTSLACEKCGAGIKAIDPEGYCSQCGFRQVPVEREHLEVIINSHLAGVSDRGLRHRRNEDFLALQLVSGTQAYILVVCDGVSSSDQPDLAAQTAALNACQSAATALKGNNPESATKLAFTTALASVCNIPYKSSANLDPPSTTIVTAIVQEGTATIGWLGDSRAYWISANSSQQLTRDDSWLTEVVAEGKITAAEASQSPHAHAITRWLGADAMEDAIPSIVNFTIPGSGYLLLCTDGLWNYAPEATQLANLVQQSSGKDAMPTAGYAYAISHSLVEFARNCGGHDNITVAVLSIL
ncbi:serine/threonine protein phosphatase [Cylindrospermum stagnale PCC 7417]|uniref:Serine/threonine protein phosphatase n=1 Tax=Cylindrospermum stagnale PCC 7417 TaxID=56107 RepID=K9WYZ1_9NOST|nr:PP2C family serine/threonine-protein phosphatase [Cylindrospermum stagnale]AFZ25433.1 serine/threonine protein phosphatase [Cylindrospermum stagnale PCC 7417]